MNNDEINKLFRDTKKSTGIDINEMKKAAKQGNMDDFLNKNLSQDATKKLKNVLANKEATEKLLSTPQAKELMKKLMEAKIILDTNMDNLNDIISSLTPDDIDMLKGVASSILGNQEDKTDGSQNNINTDKKANNSNSNALALNSLGFDNIDFDMIMKAKSIFDKMNTTSNKNVDLILALKPHLRPETRNKADQALRILKLFEVLPLLKELF